MGSYQYLMRAWNKNGKIPPVRSYSNLDYGWHVIDRKEYAKRTSNFHYYCRELLLMSVMDDLSLINYYSNILGEIRIRSRNYLSPEQIKKVQEVFSPDYPIKQFTSPNYAYLYIPKGKELNVAEFSLALFLISRKWPKDISVLSLELIHEIRDNQDSFFQNDYTNAYENAFYTSCAIYFITNGWTDIQTIDKFPGNGVASRTKEYLIQTIILEENGEEIKEINTKRLQEFISVSGFIPEVIYLFSYNYKNWTNYFKGYKTQW